MKPRMWFGKPVSPGKVPLKANVFETMVDHQGMLQQKPLFPYMGPGDVVPAAALSHSLSGMPRVHFFHYNDIQEVVLCMAGEDGLIATGQLYLQQGTHGVTAFLKKPQAPTGHSYQVSLIIIRMKTEGPQMEGFIIRCLKCNEVVYRMDRDIFAGPDHPHYRELANIRFYADAAEDFNAREQVCPSCGTPQPRFPVELMGWRRYAQYAELANRARVDIEAAAASACDGRRP
jgi:uncharacterized protein with PIN domain